MKGYKDNNAAVNNSAITCYENKNLEETFDWFKNAAENGDKNAINSLAACYKNGEGIEKNLEKAFYWFQKAAENGNKDAMYSLAICYSNGEGTVKNIENAFYYGKPSLTKVCYILRQVTPDAAGPAAGSPVFRRQTCRLRRLMRQVQQQFQRQVRLVFDGRCGRSSA